MMNINEEQKEFFKEFKEPKKGIERLREKYISSRERFVTIPIENLVFGVIILIVVGVLFFSLGVEKGKRITRPTTKIAKVVIPPITEKNLKVITEEAKPKLNFSAVKEEKITPVVIVPKYTIQIISYSNETEASKHVNALKKEGFSAFIIPKNNWFQICVGKYATKEDAAIDQKKLKNKYSDCYVRKIVSN